jgi:hypothetical protein
MASYFWKAENYKSVVVQERVTATCIGMMFNGLGGAMSYLIGILMTPEGPDNSPNSTGTKDNEQTSAILITMIAVLVAWGSPVCTSKKSMITRT